MPHTWRLLHTDPAHGAWNMALDESILEHVGRDQAPPTLRLYAWDPACLSLGYAQPYADVNLQGLHERGWEVVRRPTGGRAILHVDELTYSVIAPPSEPRLAGSVLESYNRLAGALLEAVGQLGLQPELKETPTVQSNPANPVCFEVPSSNEITVLGRKLIGSAQARRKAGVLQHGSLPLQGDLTRITYALCFDGETARAQASRRLLDRAITVEHALGRAVSWAEAAAAFARAFESRLGICFEPGTPSASELQRAAQLVHEKYNHPRWMQRV